LEERSLADSDDSDRFAGTQRDTLTSFIKTSGALTAMTAERDAALAALGRVRALTADCTATTDDEWGTHSEKCHKWHAGCLLVRIRAALEPTQPKGTK
jgi:hypothetical protein